MDIVVVQQEDGTFKSSPWYVRFGKFQGVLKAKEKIVDINVNGEEADFHMYLDQRGEAFFLREVDSEEVDAVLSPPSSSGEELDGKSLDRRPIKSKSLNYEFDQCGSVIDMSNGKRTNSRRSRILGFVLGRKSIKEKRFQEGGDDSDVVRTDSMERAEIAADLLEVRWSTNLASGRNRKDNFSRLSGSDILNEEANKNLQINDGQVQVDSLFQEHIVNSLDTAALHEGNAELNFNIPRKIDGIGVGNADRDDNVQKFVTMPDNGGLSKSSLSKNESSSIGLDGSNGQSDETQDLCSGEGEEVYVLAETFHETTDIISEVSSPMFAADQPPDSPRVSGYDKCSSFDDAKILERERISSNTSNIVAETYSEAVSTDPLTGLAEVRSCSFFTISGFSNLVSQVEDGKNSREPNEMNEIRQLGEFQKVGDFVATKETPERLEEEQFLFSDLDVGKLNEVEHMECTFSDRIENDTHSSLEAEAIEAGDEFVQESLAMDIFGRKEDSKGSPNHVDIPRNCQVTDQEVGRLAKSLPNMWSQFDEYDADHLHSSSVHSLGAKSKSSKWKLLREDITSIIKLDADKEHQLSGSQPAITDTKELTDVSGSAAAENPSDINDASSGSWRLWPFRRTRSRNFAEPSPDCKKDSEADNVSESSRDVDGDKEVSKLKAKKMKVRALAPTSEQLASLNLKEGKNVVSFTFSTSVLGEQQVEARIYLWRWDTRIVISDVDGTITKSDVLGQFMPLVGRDWSQTGVAHLFSAIKENGYQLLFLSARAISQAYQTRQFLFNIKQDGKGLPDGPVVISPDGLFPSLFREVIRRAPHEFKIACLEDIKACFPSDRNPFYAGFGNRDTDEFSYLKVGIPKGKIFIINPKGEVVVNRRVDSKSYTTLHALVNGMFPPISTHEEEDYNSWNFWKLPPPSIDI